MSLGGGRLPLDHFLLGLDLALASYFEECFRPDFILEVDAIHGVVFVIFVRAHPLVVNVRELFFQVCPAFVPLFHRFLSRCERRNCHQCCYKQYSDLCHCESPLGKLILKHCECTTSAWTSAKALPDLPW